MATRRPDHSLGLEPFVSTLILHLPSSTALWLCGFVAPGREGILFFIRFSPRLAPTRPMPIVFTASEMGCDKPSDRFQFGESHNHAGMFMNDTIYKELVERAVRARSLAYAPYSGFAVGAALLSSDGRMFEGSNVENVSLGLTMCAERVAIGNAVCAGVRTFDAIAIASEANVPVPPCGACRQVLAEFADDLDCVLVASGKLIAVHRLSALFPLAATDFVTRR